MGAMSMGMLAGFLVGAGLWGSSAGGFAGAVLGMFAGLTVFGARWAWAHSGNAPVRDVHRIMCEPSGTFADCELEGDMQRGRWLDVKRCSLLTPDNQVWCDKTCLKMINDGGPRPGDYDHDHCL